MRISDWSSDVCSSDLVLAAAVGVDGAVEGNVRRGIAGEDAAGRVPDHLGRRRRRQAGRFAEAVAAGAGAVGTPAVVDGDPGRSEEPTSEIQSLMRISYDGVCLKKNTKTRSLRT